MVNRSELETDKFFISYNKEDKAWAEWISWQLTEVGYDVFIQAWDIRPGNNFVLEMQKATQTCNRTIAVLSTHYLLSKYTQPEWASAFNQDPTGERRTLLPIKVEEVELTGLWVSIVYIDLVGLNGDEAKKALLEGISLGRVKPSFEQIFPGEKKLALVQEPSFPIEQSIKQDLLKEWTVISFGVYSENEVKRIASSFRRERSRVVEQSINKNIFEIAFTFIRNQEYVIKHDILLVLSDLLLPLSFREGLRGVKRICVKVDSETGIIPWEAIFTYSNFYASSPIEEIAVIIRQLNGRVNRTANGIHDHTALVIGNADIPDFVANITSDAVRSELMLVSNLLRSKDYKVVQKFLSSTGEIVQSLFQDNYQILHITGTGYLDTTLNNFGIVIGDGVFLTPREFNQMSEVPELVYINFGTQIILNSNSIVESDNFKYCQLAALFGIRLIEFGVKAVIISSLPVDDKVSLAFSENFYRTLLEGKNFSDAVKEARNETFKIDPRIETIAAFQCYGDVDFSLLSTLRRNDDLSNLASPNSPPTP